MSDLTAIVVNTLRLSLRSMAALILLVFILIGLVFLSLFVEGDQTLMGLLRVVTTWSFAFMSVLLMVLMVYLSSNALDVELLGKQMTLLVVKPIARWKILLGKWIGLSLLSGMFLGIMGAVIYGALIGLAHLKAKDARMTEMIEKQFFVSRHLWAPNRPDLHKESERFKNSLITQGALTREQADGAAFQTFAKNLLNAKLLPIPSGTHRRFVFERLAQSIPEKTLLTFRYRLYGREGDTPAEWLAHRWEITNPITKDFQHVDQFSKSGDWEEFQFDAHVVQGTQTLYVDLVNHDAVLENRRAPIQIMVPVEDGIGLLIPQGSYGMNFVRGLLLLWVRLVMIAGIGVSVNAFLSAPVTGFLLVCVLMGGYMGTTLEQVAAPKEISFETQELQRQDPIAAMVEQMDREHPDPLKKFLEKTRVLFYPIVKTMPDFQKTDPSVALSEGREIGIAMILRQAVFDIGFRGGIPFLLGLYAFYRKEVGLPRVV